MKIKSTVIIPAKNEEKVIAHVLYSVSESSFTNKIIVVDGHSTDNTRGIARKIGRKLKKKNIILKVVKDNGKGKGDGMIVGLKKSFKEDPQNIVCFFDADISSLNYTWVDKVVNPIVNENIDMSRGYFDRARDDALITKLVTRPLIASFFPELARIRQPLGGELALSPELVKSLLEQPICSPPSGWGIDTWLLLNAHLLGYEIKEVFLGEKIHNLKHLMSLEKMAKECFAELARIAYLDLKSNVAKSYLGKFELSPCSTKKTKVRDIKARAISNFNKYIEELYNEDWKDFKPVVSKDEKFQKFYSIFQGKEKEFLKSIEKIEMKDWITTLKRLAYLYKNYFDKTLILKIFFKFWLIYSIKYVIFHAQDFEQAEKYADDLSKLAFELRKEKL